MSRIIVTGSEGTLGKPLVHALREAGHRVLRVDLKHSNEDADYMRADVGDHRQIGRRRHPEVRTGFRLPPCGRVRSAEWRGVFREPVADECDRDA